MALLSQFKNPILWQELTHQRRNRKGRWQYGYILGIILLFGLIGLTTYTLVERDGYSAMQLGLATVWITQVAAGLRALIAGINLVSREHVGQTWDALVLTGVSARYILYGKYRAALRSVGPWMVFLAAVRLMMQPVFAIGLVKTYAYVMCQYSGQYSGYASYSGCAGDTVTWVPWAWILAAIMCVLLTVLDIAGCVALGLACSAVTKREIPAAVGSLVIRFAPVALFSGFTRHELGTGPFWVWWGHTLFSLANSGTTPILQLGLPLLPWTYNTHSEALSGLILTTMMLILFNVLGLLVAGRSIRRTGALPAQ